MKAQFYELLKNNQEQNFALKSLLIIASLIKLAIIQQSRNKGFTGFMETENMAKSVMK
jgi:hypothetical protein